MKLETLRILLDRGLTASKKRIKRNNALAILLCAAVLCATVAFAVPMLLTTTSAADGCTHTHDSTCGFVKAVPCDHKHDSKCGFVAASPCGYSHTHNDECGYDADEGIPCSEPSHSHNSSCGYAAAAACEHDCEKDEKDAEECGFVKAAPCKYVCTEVFGLSDDGEDALDEEDEPDDTDTPDDDDADSNNADSGDKKEIGSEFPTFDSQDTDPNDLWYSDLLFLDIMGLFEAFTEALQSPEFASATAISGSSLITVVLDADIDGGSLSGNNANFTVVIGGTGATVIGLARSAANTIAITIEETITFGGGTVTVAYNGSAGTVMAADTITPLDGFAAQTVTIPTPTIETVGAQSGPLTVGTAGSVTFDVTTTNIASGNYTLNFTPTALPTGVSVGSGVLNINASGAGTLTLTTSVGTPAATTELVFTMAGATSPAFDLVVSPAGTKIVMVGSQESTPTIVAGVGGFASFPVTSTGIGNGTFDITVNNLPAGVTGPVSGNITLNASGAGTLTLIGVTGAIVGNTTLTLSINDTVDITTSGNFTLTVLPSFSTTITISPSNAAVTTVPDNPANVASGDTVYLPTITAATGFSFSTWQITSGNATSPTNFNLASGASFVMGTQNVAIRAEFTANALTINSASPPNGTVGVAYSHTVTATGGTGTSYNFTSPNLTANVPGLSISSAGVISGNPTSSNNAASRTFTINVTDTVTGASTSDTYTITIAKGTRTAPAAPTLSSSTATSVTLNTITGAEYGLSASGPWQTSPIFTGLTPATAYTFFAIMPETVDFNESDASTAFDYTTPLADQAQPTVTFTRVGNWNDTGVTVTITNPTAANAVWSLTSDFAADFPVTTPIVVDPGEWNVTFYVRLDATPTHNVSPAREVYIDFRDVVATPTATPNGGTFADSQIVELATATAGATIYYTLDGTVPTTSSTEYTVPFTITATTTVRAIAVMADMQNSAVMSVTFTLEGTGADSIPGNDGSIGVPFEQTNPSTVTLIHDPAITQQLIDTAANGIVRFDFRGRAGVSNARIPTAMLTEIVSANRGIQFDLPQGSITFDQGAAASLAAAGGSGITVSLSQVHPTSLNAAQQSTLGANPGVVFSITALADSGAITSFNGTLTITLQYSGPFPAIVWHLDANGVLTQMPTMSNPAAGTITFTTTHLSVYVIRHADNQSTGTGRSPKTGDYSNTLLWWTVLLTSALGITLTFIWKKHLNAKTKWERMIEDHKSGL